MTLVHFHLTDAEGAGLHGKVGLTPTRRVTVRDAIRLPVPVSVDLDDNGEATVDVLPSTTQWVWRVAEYVASGITRHVEVPQSAQTVEYATLTDVDPKTLDQTSDTVAAWETVTRAAQSALDQIDSIDDKVTRAEQSAQAAKASEGVATQESAKAVDAAGKAQSAQAEAAKSAAAAHESETTASGPDRRSQKHRRAARRDGHTGQVGCGHGRQRGQDRHRQGGYGRGRAGQGGVGETGGGIGHADRHR